MVIAIRVTKDQVTPFMKGLQKQFPKAVDRSMRAVAKYAQRQLRSSLSRGGTRGGKPLKWTGRLWEQTEARRLRGRGWGVKIPQYGFGLDSMSPHYVSLKRGRNITRWARTAPNSPFKGGKLPRAIRVKPHPWIARPLELTDKNSLRIIDKELTKVITNV